MLRVEVAAILASIPTLASEPSIATTPSKSKPIALATGATCDKAVRYLSNESALSFAPFTNTSTTRAVSVACKPNWRRVAPTISALSPSPASRSVASANTLADISLICCAPKPSLASAICNSVTCDAVYSVERPSSFACSVIACISSLVTPSIVCKFFCCWANSMFVLSARPTALIRPTTAATTAVTQPTIAVQPAFAFLKKPCCSLSPFACSRFKSSNSPVTLRTACASASHSFVPCCKPLRRVRCWRNCSLSSCTPLL